MWLEFFKIWITNLLLVNLKLENIKVITKILLVDIYMECSFKTCIFILRVNFILLFLKTNNLL